ncbi:MAG: hypothetical protein IPK63_23530 [Candidatus Competibacteraceae bacterium]|nr:hypothetical protein [Candidatus Competibacteraceae bacterium]
MAAARFAASWGRPCRPFVAAVSFALVPLALRRAGWFRFRWPRRPLPWGVVALPAPLPSRLRPAARRCWPRRVSSSAALFPAAPPPARVGFSGGRRLSPAFRPLVAGVVSAVVAAGRSVVVGCAGGADRFVRTAAPGAVVFSVASFGSGRGAFAARSIALVRAVAAGGPGSVWSFSPLSLAPMVYCRLLRRPPAFAGFRLALAFGRLVSGLAKKQFFY